MGKEISKKLKKATEKATVKESAKITNIRYRVQHQKMKTLYGSCIHCIALVDAYESLLVECLEKKLVRGLETCESRIVFDSYQEDDISGANKIIHLLDRIRINLKFIKDSLKAYVDSSILLSKTDEKQAEFYGRYVIYVKKVIYENDNVINFNWTDIKNKDKFRNFKTIDSILEKIAKLTISAKETCTTTIDCMYASISRFWNRRLVEINNMTGGALGFIEQQTHQENSPEFMRQLRGRIQKIKKKQEKQATRQIKKEKQRLKKEKQALQQQKLKKKQYRIRKDAQEQQNTRIKNANPSSGFGLLMSHVPKSSSSSSSHYYSHYN